ncbi:MAG: hypothetical protein WDO15_26595 [Bacteroidota bacterium]
MNKFLFTAFIFIATIANCQTAIITKSEKEFIPEGITINPTDKKIYVSSVGLMKIIEIDQSGTHRDFVKSGQDGFLEGLGMKIDAKKQWLWGVSNHKEGGKYASAVHAFDLKSGSRTRQWVVRDTSKHLFNDLVLHPNGMIYITDTFASTVYEYDPVKKSISVFAKDQLLKQANGIAVNDSGKLFVATYDGLVMLDVKSKSLTPFTYKDSKKAEWMDGIVFWKNQVIGVADKGIMQYKLDEKNEYIVSEKVIDSADKNKLFKDPTTCAILGDELYVVVNSYLSRLQREQ